MTGTLQMQVVSACQCAGRLCIQQSPSWLVPHAKVEYFLASHPWTNIDFCSTECVCDMIDWSSSWTFAWMKETFLLSHRLSPLGSQWHLPALSAHRQSAPGFLQGLDFPLHCRQASKLAPRHVSWLSALSSLGQTNRCSALSSLQVSRQGKLAKSL